MADEEAPVAAPPPAEEEPAAEPAAEEAADAPAEEAPPAAEEEESVLEKVEDSIEDKLAQLKAEKEARQAAEEAGGEGDAAGDFEADEEAVAKKESSPLQQGIDARLAELKAEKEARKAAEAGGEGDDAGDGAGEPSIEDKLAQMKAEKEAKKARDAAEKQEDELKSGIDERLAQLKKEKEARKAAEGQNGDAPDNAESIHSQEGKSDDIERKLRELKEEKERNKKDGKDRKKRSGSMSRNRSPSKERPPWNASTNAKSPNHPRRAWVEKPGESFQDAANGEGGNWMDSVLNKYDRQSSVDGNESSTPRSNRSSKSPDRRDRERGRDRASRDPDWRDRSPDKYARGESSDRNVRVRTSNSPEAKHRALTGRDMPESQRSRPPREQDLGYRNKGADLRDLLDGNYSSSEELNGAPTRPPPPRSSRRDDRGYPSDYDPGRSSEMSRRDPYYDTYEDVFYDDTDSVYERKPPRPSSHRTNGHSPDRRSQNRYASPDARSRSQGSPTRRPSGSGSSRLPPSRDGWAGPPPSAQPPPNDRGKSNLILSLIRDDVRERSLSME